MEIAGRDWHHDYSYDAPELAENFDEIVDDLVAHCPVSRSREGEGYYVFNKAADVKEICKDWQTFSSKDGFIPNRPADMPFWAPLECDPPFHKSLRETLHPFLSPKAVREHEPEIRQIAHELVDSFIADGEVEFVESFANALPAQVFCKAVIGMPADDMPFLRKTFQQGLVGPVAERGAAMQRGMDHIEKYLAQRAEEEPRGDILDALLAFEWPRSDEGEPHGGYEWTGKVGTATQLVQGGIGTTGFVLAGGMYHMATHPDDREQLVAQPDLLPSAIEEFLRFYTPGVQVGRRVTRDCLVGDTQLKQGDYVVMSFGAASRDPDHYDNGGQIVIDRPANTHSFAFSSGQHRCVGSHLGRANLRIGFEVLLERIPEFSVPDDFVPTYQIGGTRDMVELPLRFAS